MDSPPPKKNLPLAVTIPLSLHFPVFHTSLHRAQILVDDEPEIAACTQERCAVLLGGFTYFVESTWSNDAQRSICYWAAYNK
jgi:hypothetical protein